MVVFAASGASAQTCSCPDVLASYASWVEANHIGYAFEVRDRDPRPYQRRKADYERRARRTPLSECVHLVEDWLSVFGDPHLSASRQMSDSLRVARGVPASLGTRSVVEAVARLDRPGLDPIEGVWRSGDRQIVVTEEPDLRGVFTATVVERHDDLGLSGTVIARFDHGTEYGRYRMHGAGALVDTREASLHRRALLHTGSLSWGRDSAEPTNPVHPTDPLHPVLRVLDDETVLVTLPSHLPPYKAALDSLLAAHRDVLARAPIVLIDVRGNRGGSGDTARPLAPFYTSPALYANPRPTEAGWILASPYNRALYRYLHRAMGGDEAHPWIRQTVDRLEAAEDGEIVRDRFDLVEPFRPDSVNASTRVVGLITDWINLSAVDVLMMEATASDRVVHLGEATDSAIDYQNAWTVPLDEPAACAAEGFRVTYPRSAASWMPDAPRNPTGFVPDVPLDEATGDWVRAAQAHLKSRLGDS